MAGKSNLRLECSSHYLDPQIVSKRKQTKTNSTSRMLSSSQQEPMDQFHVSQCDNNYQN